jgi:hypothetical protein
MLVRCPSCSHGFDIIEITLGVKATVVCPACARVVVIRAAETHTAEATLPFDAGTMATVEEATDLSGGRFTLALPEGKRVSLAAVTGPRKGVAFPFASPKLLIGRAGGGGGADVELDDPDVSRKHALVECHGTRIVLQDLRSTNGTFVGVDRVESRELKDGEEFRVGRSRFLLVVTPE